MGTKFKIVRKHDDGPDEEWNESEEWVATPGGTRYESEKEAEDIALLVGGGDHVVVRPAV